MESPTQPKTLPLWKSALEAAEAEGLLEYGTLLTFPWLEEHFSAERDEMAFLGEKIHFCKALKKRGFILTERGTNGEGCRVLTKAEMAEYVKRSELKKAKQSALHAACLGAVDTSDMDEIEQKKHEHWTAKAGLSALVQMNILRRRKLPSPEMVEKSLKQIS